MRFLATMLGVVAIVGAAAAVPPPESLASRAVTRVALMDLRMIGAPEAEDFQVASALLGVAAELDPTDEVLLRYRVECAAAAGDRGLTESLTRELVKVRPDDTVAQLRFISERIAQLQDAEARLSAYDRFLSADGASLDASIRSRLALDSALLLREMGRTKEFAERLSLAVSIDPTNKDAASMAVTFFTQSSGDAAGRLDLLLNLLFADPLDPATFLSIARELAGGGDFSGARRFYDFYEMVLAKNGSQMGEAIRAEGVVVDWRRLGAAEVVDRLRSNVEQLRTLAQQQIRAAEAAGAATEALVKPSEVRLSADLDRVRLLAAMSVEDTAQVDAAYKDLSSTLNHALDEMNALAVDPSRRDKNVTDEQIRQRRSRVRAEIIWMRLWCAREIEQAEAGITELEQDPDTNPAAIARLRGWLALRKGDLEAAEAVFSPLAAEDSLAALGMAVVKEFRLGLITAEGNSRGTSEAADAYLEVSRRTSGSPAGAYAATRYRVLTGENPPPTDVARALAARSKGVPNWMDRIVSDPSRFMTLKVAITPDRFGALDEPMVNITLKNVSPIPLAVGPTAPINSVFLLTPNIELGGVRLGDGPGAVPVVVSGARRLRLLPFETLSFDVRPTATPVGWGMQEWVGASVGIRWRAVQGFGFSSIGLYEIGPYCLQDETDASYRQRTADFDRPAADIAADLKGARFDRGAELLQVFRARLSVPAGQPGALTDPEKTAIVGAIAELLPTLDKAGKLYVLGALPTAVRDPLLKPIDDAARAETDPAIRLVVLVTRVTSPDDPLLAESVGAGLDPGVARVMSLVRERLKSDRPCLARTANVLQSLAVNPMRAGAGD